MTASLNQQNEKGYGRLTCPSNQGLYSVIPSVIRSVCNHPCGTGVLVLVGHLPGRFGGENPSNKKVIKNSPRPSDIKLKVRWSHRPRIINLRMRSRSNPCVVRVITIIQFLLL